jgi:3-oxoacyl-(acyl-carrier-protein) synthase
MGEGAVLYVLEAEEHAKARGARIYATIAGYGTSADATHITAPDVRGQSIAIRAALADAGMAVGDIGYINAHGTATPAGDVVETQSIREVFGARADVVPISSTKSIHGHLLGASGAIEMVAALVALLDGVIAPTANLDEPDPQCDLDYVPNRPRTGVKLDAVMSNTFAFGGANVSLILRR